MLKLEFTNASVVDNGYGVEINGKDLNKLISTALGVRAGDNYGYGSELPAFKSNCCNVTICIDPQPVTTHIETNEDVWESVEELEKEVKEKYEQSKQKNAKTDTEK